VRFAFEASQAIGIGGKRLREHLQGDVAMQSCVARPVHLAHSARADGRQNLVRAEAGSGVERQARDGRSIATPLPVRPGYRPPEANLPAVRGRWTLPYRPRDRRSPDMNSRRSSRSLVIALPLVAVAAFAALGAAQNREDQGDPLIAGFKSTYAASVSDAVELVTGKNGTMR